MTLGRHVLILLLSITGSAVLTAAGHFHATSAMGLLEILGPFLGFYMLASMRFGNVVPLGVFVGSGAVAYLMTLSPLRALSVAAFSGMAAFIGEKTFLYFRVHEPSLNIGRNISRQVSAAFAQVALLLVVYACYAYSLPPDHPERTSFTNIFGLAFVAFQFLTYSIIVMSLNSLTQIEIGLESYIKVNVLNIIQIFVGLVLFLGPLFYCISHPDSFGLVALSFLGLFYLSTVAPVNLLAVVTVLAALACLYSHRFGVWPLQHGTSNQAYAHSVAIAYCIGSLSMVFLDIKREGVFKRAAFSVLMSLLVCTICFWYFDKREEQADAARLDSIIQEFQSHLNARFSYYESALNAAKGLVLSTDEMSPLVWRKFVEQMDISARYYGINGVGQILSINHDDLDEFIAREKKRNPDFLYKIVPGGRPREELDVHYVINMIEPVLSNRAAVGLDIASNELRRRAAELSQMVGRAAITKKITLVQDSGKRPGFLMMLPFQRDQSVSHSANRFSSKGWVYAPFVTEKFVGPALALVKEKVNVKVFENSELLEESLIFSQTEKIENYRPLLKERLIRIAQQDWYFQFSTPIEFHQTANHFSIVILCLFVIMCGAVAIVIASIHQVALENKKLAQNLQTKFEEASQITVLGELTAGIAHEINNPLSIIHGKTQQLLSRMERNTLEPQYLKEALTTIYKTVERTAKTVKGLKALSRRGEADPKIEIELKTIVENSLEICREKFKNHSIELQVSEIPDVLINCREVQISQVVINLINNAFDAIKGKENPWVKLNFEVTGDHVEIQVFDCGSGIPPEIAAKLMTPFFTTKPSGVGTGLGLSISKKIISDHDGDLYIDQSKINTCFVVKLPCRIRDAIAA